MLASRSRLLSALHFDSFSLSRHDGELWIHWRYRGDWLGALSKVAGSGLSCVAVLWFGFSRSMALQPPESGQKGIVTPTDSLPGRVEAPLWACTTAPRLTPLDGTRFRELQIRPASRRNFRRSSTTLRCLTDEAEQDGVPVGTEPVQNPPKNENENNRELTNVLNLPNWWPEPLLYEHRRRYQIMGP